MAATFAIYSLLIVLVSLVGGLVPLAIRMTHRRLQVATSLIAGFMLGVALLHLLPHSLFAIPPGHAMIAVLCGVLAMFFLERFFHSHQHIAPGDDGKPPVTADPEPSDTDCDVPGDIIDHHHGHTHARYSWVGISIGLVLHSLIAGAALGAAMLGESGLGPDGQPGHGYAANLPGLAVFLVIVLHRPFDSMTLLTLLRATGWSRGLAHVVNVGFALLVPLGGVLLFAGLAGDDIKHSQWVGYALAVAAGVFLCVALADLLPEVRFHSHDRVLLSGAVIVGLALAWAIAHFEAQSHNHDHGHGHGNYIENEAGDHTGHNHEGHGHEGHGHEGHKHQDHSGHNHQGHDHGDHEGHDH